MEKSLLKKLYHERGELKKDKDNGDSDTETDSSDDQRDDEKHNSDLKLSSSKARDEFNLRLSKREALNHSFWHWVAIKVLFDCLCCCFNKYCYNRRPKGCWSRKLHLLRRFEAARQALRAEQDVESIVKVHRLSRLMGKVFLTRQQRMMTTYFRKYVIKDRGIEKIRVIRDSEPPKPPYSTDSLADALILDEGRSVWDSRLLYEVTGRRFNEDDYQDETSDDEMEDEHSWHQVLKQN